MQQNPLVLLDMAQAVLGLIDIGFSVGNLISGAIQNNKAEQQFRDGWTQSARDELSAAYPEKNVMVIYTDHDASKLVGVEKKGLECVCPTGAKLAYVVYLFDEGLFHLKGDGYVICVS